MKKLYLVWYEENNKVLNKIATITYSENKYIFEYSNQEYNDLQLFSKNGLFYGFEDINKKYESTTLFPSILDRLPSKKRLDYNQIKKTFNIEENDTDFDILQKTKGKISDDNFIFITQEEYDSLKMDEKI